MSELGGDVALVVVRAQAASIGATMSRELGVGVTVEVDRDLVVVRVSARRPSGDLARAVAALFERVTVGLGPVSYEVAVGPHLSVVPPLDAQEPAAP